MIETASTSFVERYRRAIFIAALFGVVFFCARIAVRPVNTSDYNNYLPGLRAFWAGQSPYTSPEWFMPPWAVFFLAPLVNQPLETWLALSVALCVGIIFDLGRPSGLLLLAHPVFLTLLASSNPEWLVIGPGVWLLYRAPKGWGRGLAWLLLTCKPQTSAPLLLFDGWEALRERDWKAFWLAGAVAVGSTLLYPQFFGRFTRPFEKDLWSASVLSHYGILGALVVTALILLLRGERVRDRKTLGLLLGPVWGLFMLQYSYTAMILTLRSAGWVRNAIFLVGSIGLAALFWQEFHVSEQIGMLGMVLLAAALAPAQLAPTAPSPAPNQADGTP